MKIKKNDNVIVIAGKDRGKKGKVSRSLPSLERVVVEGVNIVKRRQRSKQANKKGQVLESASPVHVSNVQIWCAKCQKGVRSGNQKSGTKKVRICKSCGEVL